MWQCGKKRAPRIDRLISIRRRKGRDRERERDAEGDKRTRGAIERNGSVRSSSSSFLMPYIRYLHKRVKSPSRSLCIAVYVYLIYSSSSSFPLLLIYIQYIDLSVRRCKMYNRHTCHQYDFQLYIILYRNAAIYIRE